MRKQIKNNTNNTNLLTQATTIKDMGNAHWYESGKASFNGKECIMLKMAADQSRKAFNAEFKKRYDLFFYYEVNTPK